MGSTVLTSQQDLVSTGATRPKTSREEVRHYRPLSDSPCNFQPWAEAACPGWWRISLWRRQDGCSHLHISLVPALKLVHQYSHGSELSDSSQSKLVCVFFSYAIQNVANLAAWAERGLVFVTNPLLSQFQLRLGYRPHLSCFPGHCSATL